MISQFFIDVWILANHHGMDGDELGIVANRLREKLLEEHTEDEFDKLAYPDEFMVIK